MTSFTWYDVSDATVGFLFGIAGVLAGYALRGLIGRWQAEAIERQAKWKLETAETEVKNLLKDADIQARTVVVKAREEFEISTKARRKELADADARMTMREENFEKKSAQFEVKESEYLRKRDALGKREEEVAALSSRALSMKTEAEATLQRIAGLTRDEARKKITEETEEEIRASVGTWLRRAQEEARTTADREAQKVIATAVQRYSVSHASEWMVTTVALPNEEVKGRIIGREGRNIRTIEALTGVSVLVDDTPGMVVLSSFDPMRREITRRALERLVEDGRIHPTRIEEVVKEVCDEFEKSLLEVGESGALEADVRNLPEEVLRKLGRLKFRTSFTQNVLRHSIEVAQLMGLMAGEMGADPVIARRVGLLHDIGKALDQEFQGGHATIGAAFLRRNGECELVANAVEAHHEDVSGESVYATLCSAADAISSSRPGARMASTGLYVQRLTDLEKIANSFTGVKKTFAVQAGREVRVVVDPVVVNDNEAMILARDICKRIEEKMQFPGQIRVVVVRETRCVEYAR